jgi:uncharacterized protein
MAEIRVQICYARPGQSSLREVVLPLGATLRSAIERSGLLHDASEIDLTVCRVGVYGKLKPLDAVLREHDRVEIYRPLVADPKESRRKRAQKKDAAASR